MDYRTITAYALRLTGVIILVMTVPYAPSAFMQCFHAGSSSLRESLLLTAFAQLIPILVGLALAYFPARLSSLVAGSSPEPQADEMSEPFGEIAVIAVGIYSLLRASSV